MLEQQLFCGREPGPPPPEQCRQCKGDVMHLSGVRRCGTCGLPADAVLAWEEHRSPVAADEPAGEEVAGEDASDEPLAIATTEERKVTGTGGVPVPGGAEAEADNETALTRARRGRRK